MTRLQDLGSVVFKIAENLAGSIRRPPSWGLVWILIGLALSWSTPALAQCFQGEQQRRLERSLRKPLRSQTCDVLKQLKTLKKKKLWLPLVTLCDEILQGTKLQGQLVYEAPDSWKSARSYARELLHSLPAEAREIYRKMRGVEAKRLWKRGDEEALEILLRTYPLPEYEVKARRRLGNLWLEEGRLHDAFRLLGADSPISKAIPKAGIAPLKALITLTHTRREAAKIKDTGSKKKTEQARSEILKHFYGAKKMALRRVFEDDPNFQGAEFDGLDLPKQRRYILEGSARGKVYRRTLCVLGGRAKALDTIFLSTGAWIYGLLEHELLICINRRLGELCWVRDLRPSGPLPIEIGGAALNHPRSHLALGIEGLLLVQETKRQATWVDGATGKTLSEEQGREDDLFFRPIHGGLLRVEKSGQMGFQSKKLTPKQAPVLVKGQGLTLTALGEALIVTRRDSTLIWYPGRGERYLIRGPNPEKIDEAKRTAQGIRIRYRGSKAWDHYSPIKQRPKLAIPKGS